MKHFRVLRAIAFKALIGFLAPILFDLGMVHGQAPATPQVTLDDSVELPLRTPATVNKSGPNTTGQRRLSAFGPAGSRNALLRNELNWTFGGKPQRGWYLYTPLINNLLGTKHGSASEGFASALASWQRKAGLKPTGVLDEESLYAMISEWQLLRLKERNYPAPDQLVTASGYDFFDPSRPDELRLIERNTYAAYKHMVSAAAADPSLGLAHAKGGGLAPAEKLLKIISAFRTREYQEQLRQQSPNAGSAGLALNSPHFTGRALDLYVGGEPVETKDSNRAVQVQTRVYQWLVRNAGRFGFHPYFFEPWHWEHVKK